jgi:hypothetical protein
MRDISYQFLPFFTKQLFSSLETFLICVHLRKQISSLDSLWFLNFECKTKN